MPSDSKPPFPLRSVQPTQAIGEAAAAEKAEREAYFQRYMGQDRRTLTPPPPVTVWSRVTDFFTWIRERIQWVFRSRPPL